MFWHTKTVKNSTGFPALLLVSSSSSSGNSTAALKLSADVAVFLYVYIPLKAVIVAGNLLTVVAVAADRTRHTTPYVFTASLAVADLLIGLSVVYDIILLTAPELQPSMACPVNFIMCAALAESAQCTTLIALDRTLVIKYSLRYPVWMTGLRTAAVVCLTVLLSLAYSALILGLVAGWSAEACDIWTVIGTHDSLLPMVTPLCVFLLITGCLYSYVLVIAYRQRVAIAKVHSVIPLSDRVAPQVYSITKKMSIGVVAPPKLHPNNPGSSSLSRSTSGISAFGGMLKETDSSASRLENNDNDVAHASAGPAEEEGGAYTSEPDPVTNAGHRISLMLPSGDSTSDSGSSHSNMPSLAGSLADVFSVARFNSWSSLPNLHDITTISDISAELAAEKSVPNNGSTPASVRGANLPEWWRHISLRATSGMKRNFSATTVKLDVVAERPPVRNASLPAFPSTSVAPSDNSSIVSRKDIMLQEPLETVEASASTTVSASDPIAQASQNTPARNVTAFITANTATSVSTLAISKLKESFPINTSVFKARGSASNRLSTDTGASVETVRSCFFGISRGSGSGLWKSFRMFFLVWGIYFLTLTPIIASGVVFSCHSVPQERIDFLVRIDLIFIFINSGINVFIYAWKDRRLRKSLWLVLRCKWSEI